MKPYRNEDSSFCVTQMNLENYSFTFEMDGQAVKYIYEVSW